MTSMVMPRATKGSNEKESQAYSDLSCHGYFFSVPRYCLKFRTDVF